MQFANIGIGLAFLAGLASFLSPCVFSLVPAYVGYLGGRSVASARDGKAHPWISVSHGIFFVLGFSTVFILLGIATSLLGGLLLRGADLAGADRRRGGDHLRSAHDRHHTHPLPGIRSASANYPAPQPGLCGFFPDGRILLGRLVAVRRSDIGVDPDPGIE